MVLVVQIVDPQFRLDRGSAVLGEEDVPSLGVRLVVAPRTELPHRRQHLTSGGLTGGGSGEHEGNQGLVHQHGIRFVDDRHIRRRGDEIVRVRHQLLTQDVEPDLRDRAVGDVAGVGFPALDTGRGLGDTTDGESEELEHRGHPRGVAGREVVVHRDDVDGVPLEGVARGGDRPRERLALACGHLDHVAGEHPQCALQLHVERPQVDRAGGGLPRQSEESRLIVSGVTEKREPVGGVGELGIIQSRRPVVEPVGGVHRALRA